MKIRKAVIPAAGLGTRFLPATKALPKEMLPIIDKPTIQYIVEEAVASGIEEIIIVTGKGKQAIEDHFDSSFELENHLKAAGKLELLQRAQEPTQLAKLHYIRQTEPLGLGHAIWCARAFIQNEPFAVLLGDTFFDAQIPALSQLIQTYDRYQTSIIGVQEVDAQLASNYGVVEAKLLNEGIYLVSNLIEKPAPEEAVSNLAILGRYILTPRIFDLLAKQQAGIGSEIQLTDALLALNQFEAMYACKVQGDWHDIGNHQGYIGAILAETNKRPKLKQWLHERLSHMLRETE
ncbi:UTP--glucose-1-phosphate uridylyltransferase GalU [Paenibacillus sp. HWE-109]|uniref:UTP--glucose-1-phosphate uridylyltransferase GalU n=1 Tax=Paenibacillus sp. HWE-109 TaxID=1306526 RepID=UPI001EDE83FE|nr:UTP--glucose-1-phosphate uridylyltransferase GalU [Paenibacillus sp. HWE-109]UKS30430.1 UTP--glucose-1-phosphate uridylyltransferase GalU [Paenibacillus sp. HWE-109]